MTGWQAFYCQMWEDEGIARFAVWLWGVSSGVDDWSREDIVMAYVDSEAPLKVLMAKVYRERRLRVIPM